ncbi:hypothetical protein INS49_004445 [Diaporthe citri]|uniref:uncharacterized protein n=1 Tax=Diaporthe citri TaxID=83186 RepID=UPI001C802268|nr:uncharacterized protein INS49_004445 [Diaporthe citri]KAG6354428.1 hypothetical protein INS49_004445 [Diaporthe citri]
MSLRSCPKKACHTETDPEGCTGYHRGKRPVTPAPEMTESVVDELPSLETAPVPGLGNIPRPFQRPAASAGTHVKYLVDV